MNPAMPGVRGIWYVCEWYQGDGFHMHMKLAKASIVVSPLITTSHVMSISPVVISIPDTYNPDAGVGTVFNLLA